MEFKELDNSIALNTFIDIYALSKKYYDSNCPITNIRVSKNASIESIINFFNNLNPLLESNILKYYDLSHFYEEIEGLLFAKKEKVSSIKLPFFNNLFSSSIGVHEYTHALNYDHICTLNDESQFDEVLPFFNQFLYLDYFGGDGEKVIKDAKYYMLNNQIFYNIKKFMFLIDIIDKENIDEIQRNQLLEKVSEHYKYIIGSLYSLNLYDYYNMDKTLFMNMYRGIYNNESNVNNLLDFYGISVKNKENVMLVKSLIRK